MWLGTALPLPQRFELPSPLRDGIDIRFSTYTTYLPTFTYLAIIDVGLFSLHYFSEQGTVRRWGVEGLYLGSVLYPGVGRGHVPLLFLAASLLPPLTLLM